MKFRFNISKKSFVLFFKLCLEKINVFYRRSGCIEKILLGILLIIFILKLFPQPLINQGMSFSREVYDRNGKLLRITLSSDEKYRRWVSISKISPKLKEAVLLQEDRWFFFHPGINPISLLKAFWNSYIAKTGFRMGGSTITMQLTRMLYDIDSRSIFGKLLQILKAVELEFFYSKQEILEAYLNLVPCGGNIEGFSTASLIYFSKDTDKLTPPEIMTLCVIPKSPARRSLTANKGSISLEANKARHKLFDRWLKEHPADEKYLGAFPTVNEIRPIASLPFSAPHFVGAALNERLIGNRLDTTLDLKTQKLMENQIVEYVRQKKHLGIFNASALLIDIKNVEVRGAVGSADFYDKNIEGQINGAIINRSPGSALKPFIYGLALEQGLIHPMTMLKDTPVSYGGFNPENFDKDFSGPIYAKDALIRSRNIPAINLAQRLSTPSFYEFLRKADVAPLKEESHYGMALVLGGAEVSMKKVGELYTMLANGGGLRSLRYFSDEDNSKEKRLLSPESSFIVLDMLKDNPRPNQGFRKEWMAFPKWVAWKTGTSSGFKDAWSIGVFGHYVLAVWVGNFNWESNPAFVGVEAAAPLMFNMIDAIHATEKDLRPFTMTGHESLEVEVCAVSGDIPGPHCRKKTETWFIPGKSPIKTCEVHRALLIDNKTGKRACNHDKRKNHLEVYEFWPSDILKVFKKGGIPRRIPPPVNSACPDEYYVKAGISPVITSPQEDVTYNLRMKDKKNSIIPFTAVTDADVRTIYWFMNQDFVGKSKSGENLFLSPAPGKYIVRAVDDQGRSDSKKISIEIVE